YPQVQSTVLEVITLDKHMIKIGEYLVNYKSDIEKHEQR
ncbi:unnamed protein product, partial [Rotaria sp. Silwood2]